MGDGLNWLLIHSPTFFLARLPLLLVTTSAHKGSRLRLLGLKGISGILLSVLLLFGRWLNLGHVASIIWS